MNSLVLDVEDGHNAVIHQLVNKRDLRFVRMIVGTRRSRIFAIVILWLLGQWTQPADLFQTCDDTTVRIQLPSAPGGASGCHTPS